MVVNLQFVPDFIVANVITKMTGLSFKNSCLSSKLFNEIAEKHRKSIKIWLPDYELKLDASYWEGKAGDENDVHEISIERCHEEDKTIHTFSFEYLPGEMLSTRPELQLFNFETVFQSKRSQTEILAELQEARFECNQLEYNVPDDYFLDFIRILKPKKLMVLNSSYKLKASEVFDEVTLGTLDHLCYCVTSGNQIINSFDFLTPRVPSMDIFIDRRNLKVTAIVDQIKKYLVDRILKNCTETVNQRLHVSYQLERKVKLATITRPFLYIPHTAWKLKEEDDDKHIFIFLDMANGSTLVLYFTEAFSIGYQIVSRIDQFYDFFADCRKCRRPLDREKVFDTDEKKEKLNYIKMKYFPND